MELIAKIYLVERLDRFAKLPSNLLPRKASKPPTVLSEWEAEAEALRRSLGAVERREFRALEATWKGRHTYMYGDVG